MRSDISCVLRPGTSIPRSAIFAHILGPWFHMDPAIRMRLPLRVTPRAGPPVPAMAPDRVAFHAALFCEQRLPALRLPRRDIHALGPPAGAPDIGQEVGDVGSLERRGGEVQLL